MSSRDTQDVQHAAQEIFAGADGANEMHDAADRLDRDPAALAAVDALLQKDTLSNLIDSSVINRMRQLPSQLLAVMSQLKEPECTVTRSLPEAGRPEQVAALSILSPPQAPDEIGRLGGFKILRVLGQGGMGLVFEALDVQLKRHVALKVMKPEVAAKPENRQRFLNEAQAAARLEHDHIVPIFHVGEEQGVPFIEMPFLKGETLAERLHKGPRLATAEILRIGIEVSGALAAAHAANLIHRDIKPANIWLDATTDRARILDFGLARLGGSTFDLTHQNALLGTPGYMSPEQIHNNPPVDQRSDLFSLGCVLYEMTTGQRPFSGSTVEVVLFQVTSFTPPAPNALDPRVPAALSRLIVQMLEKTQSRRPERAQIVADALTRMQQGAAAPVAAPAQTPHSRKLHLAAAALLLALVGTGVLFGNSIVRFVRNEGELVVEINDPDVRVVVRQDDMAVEGRSDNRWVLTAGKGVVEVDDLKTGQTLVSREFVLQRNGKVQLRVTQRDVANARERLPADLPLSKLEAQLGKRHTFTVTGKRTGLVWGSDVYTQDSDLATAAVHAGLLRDGETGKVEMEFVNPPEFYIGSIRYGAVTMPFDRFPTAFRFPNAMPTPVSLLTPVRLVGARFKLQLTGKPVGQVWGSDVYTQDSDLASAAVHAGVLRNGESRLIEIEFIEAPASYAGTFRNGVATAAFGPYPLAFRFASSALVPDAPAKVDTQVGKRRSIEVTGRRLGTVWGTDVYTQDSDLAVAAVHAGVLRDGETSKVTIELVEPPAKYDGTFRNGVATSAFGHYRVAFRFVDAPPAPILLQNVDGQVGKRATFNATGRATGVVWGTDVYTQDSDLATAAVHAGILRDGQTGKVEIEFVNSPEFFLGSVRNGTMTYPFDRFPMAFRFVNATPGPIARLTPIRLVGKRHTFDLTGSLTGAVWGSDVYTQDSDLGTAAVHAGVLKAGEVGKVDVEFVEPPAFFSGDTRHGVTSGGFGAYPFAFRFVNAKPVPVAPVPAAPEVIRRQSLDLVGARSGGVWGSEVYTQDSDMATAAVHAGILKDGQAGKVDIEFVSAPASYVGTTRNGVTSFPYGRFPSAFRFAAAPQLHQGALLSSLVAKPGDRFWFIIEGRTTPDVWGTDIYTQDSNLASAAVHAGLIKDMEAGVVEIEIVAPPESYTGSTRNGVTSSPFVGFPGAFRFSTPKAARRFSLITQGLVNAPVWGTDVYTMDSPVGTAAVHAGLLKANELGRIEVELVAAPDRFRGSSRNGITSLDWNAPWTRACYRIVRVTTSNLMTYANQIGKKVSIQVTGSITPAVWGTDLYTLDSDIATAAVHAGILKPGQSGTVELEIIPPPDSLAGTTRNGVTSVGWKRFDSGVFRFVR